MKATLVNGFLLVLFFALGIPGGHVVYGQALSSTAVAHSIVVADGVVGGDIVRRDGSGRYGHTSSVGDESMYGVVVDDPLLYVVQGETETGTRPVITTGEAVVNVTTVGGPIRAGDLITTSPLAGLGQRTSRDHSVYALGIALDDMTEVETERTDIPQGVQYGQVRASLRMGLYAALDSGTDAENVDVGNVVSANQTEQTWQDSYFPFFRYLLAAIVALAAIIIALRSFGGTLAQSVVSIGRNPMARKVIVSMMLWNSFLIVVVSGVGLGLAVVILIL